MLVQGLKKNIGSSGGLYLLRPVAKSFRRAQLADAETLQFFGRIAIGKRNGLIGGDNDAVRIQKKHFISGVMEKHTVCFQRQLRLFTGGNVLLDRYEMRNCGVGVPDGRNGHFFVI